jgi:hypothetical protein
MKVSTLNEFIYSLVNGVCESPPMPSISEGVGLSFAVKNKNPPLEAIENDWKTASRSKDYIGTALMNGSVNAF